MLCMIVVAIRLVGPKAYIVIQLSVSFIAGVAGTWLFYVQHQYEGAYWRRAPEWDFVQAALRGSSYFKLPKVLQWFTGNIGFHHVHHLAPQIPNYYLERAWRNNPDVFGHVEPLTLRESLRTFTLALWDEEQQELVSFRSVKDGIIRHRAGGVAADATAIAGSDSCSPASL